MLDMSSSLMPDTLRHNIVKVAVEPRAVGESFSSTYK